jgi:hypothetical protein
LRTSSIGDRAAKVFVNILNVAFIALLGRTTITPSNRIAVRFAPVQSRRKDDLLARHQNQILKRAADKLHYHHDHGVCSVVLQVSDAKTITSNCAHC